MLSGRSSNSSSRLCEFVPWNPGVPKRLIFKMSLALISLSVMLIFYGQFLLHNRCTASECLDDDGDNKNKEGDFVLTTLRGKEEVEQLILARGASEKGKDDITVVKRHRHEDQQDPDVSDGVHQDISDSNDVVGRSPDKDVPEIIRHRHRDDVSEEAGADGKDTGGDVETEEGSSNGLDQIVDAKESFGEEMTSPFGINAAEPPPQSLAVVSWIREMSDLNNKSLSRPDPNPLGENPRELLFPCARDEITVSDGLENKGEDDEGNEIVMTNEAIKRIYRPFAETADKNLNGFGRVDFGPDSLCRSLGIAAAEGKFVNGRLAGEARIEFPDKSFMIANFNNGAIHGLARSFWCKFGPCDVFEDGPWNAPRHIKEICWYRDGRRVGQAWEFRLGGGFVTGAVDVDGQLTNKGGKSDREIAYVYPDKFTALVGTFEKGAMIAARETRLDAFRVDETSIGVLSFKTPMGKAFAYEQSNKTHILTSKDSTSVHRRDPYEEQFLYVADSTIEGAGRGIFVRRKVPMGTIIGFYNGVRMSDFESKLRRADRKSPYRMDNDWASPGQVLNVPEDFREPFQYSASLGHLINHSPNPNAWYAMIDHPRFGKVRSVVAKRDLRPGEEVFCDYGFIQQFLQSEDVFHTILDVGQVLSGTQDKQEFHGKMKQTVKYLKNQVNNYKPYFEMFKSLYSNFLASR